MIARLACRIIGHDYRWLCWQPPLHIIEVAPRAYAVVPDLDATDEEWQNPGICIRCGQLQPDPPTLRPPR